MEMKKLHMGTVSYGFESMDEVAHQLHVAFGSGDKGRMLRVAGFTAHTRSYQRIKDTCRLRPVHSLPLVDDEICHQG